jgi:hypothetical protein
VRRSLAVKELGVYWRQRFSFKLCKLGDENTAFYHASASARLRSNKIQVLHDGRVPAYTHAAKERILHSFYVGLLGTASHVNMPPPARPPPRCLWTVHPGGPLLTIGGKGGTLANAHDE